MNKKLLTTIGLSVLVLCAMVYVAGCEKKTDTGTKACAADCTKPCCAAGAEAKVCAPGCTKPCCAKDTAKACAPGCTKPCCAKDAAATDAKKCPAGCTKPCCAAKTVTDAVEKAAEEVKDAVEHPEHPEHPQ